MKRLAIIALLLTSCRNTPEPCSPVAVVVGNELCVQAIAQALGECPVGAKVAECPEAQAVSDACALVFRYQEAKCSAE